MSFGGKEGIAIIAHRGAAAGGGENTIRAFQEALDAGASGFECDVRLTRDGEPVVLHTRFGDDDVSTILKTKRPFSSFSWRELRAASSERPFGPVPHLDEVLTFARDSGAEVHIEPKEESLELLATLVKSIRRYGVIEQVAVITFLTRQRLLRQVRELDRGIRTNAIVIWPFADLRRAVRRAEANVLTLGWRGFNQFRCAGYMGLNIGARLRACREQGVKIMGGYGDSGADVSWLLDLGVNGIFTNRVELVGRVVQERYGG